MFSGRLIRFGGKEKLVGSGYLPRKQKGGRVKT